MQSEEFNREIDHLVDSGETTFKEYEIGLEAFHLLRQAGRQISFLQRLLLFLFAICLLMLVCIAFLLLRGDDSTANKDSKSTDNISTAIVDTIEKLKTENKVLKEQLASHEREINIRQEIEDEMEKSTQTSDFPPLIEDVLRQDTVIYHELKEGETLYSIAKKYYGNGVRYPEILKDNNLTEPSQAKKGMQLKIFLSKKTLGK